MSDGPDPRPERPSMQEALGALKATPGPVPAGYTPPVSTFPMTPAAAVAKRLSRAK